MSCTLEPISYCHSLGSPILVVQVVVVQEEEEEAVVVQEEAVVVVVEQEDGTLLVCLTFVGTCGSFTNAITVFHSHYPVVVLVVGHQVVDVVVALVEEGVAEMVLGQGADHLEDEVAAVVDLVQGAEVEEGINY